MADPGTATLALIQSLVELDLVRSALANRRDNPEVVKLMMRATAESGAGTMEQRLAHFRQVSATAVDGLLRTRPEMGLEVVKAATKDALEPTTFVAGLLIVEMTGRWW